MLWDGAMCGVPAAQRAPATIGAPGWALRSFVDDHRLAKTKHLHPATPGFDGRGVITNTYEGVGTEGPGMSTHFTVGPGRNEHANAKNG